jgi:predicted MFS family arabinose efflux permease
VLGFGFSFPWASIASTVLRQTPERERGSAVGVLSAFYDLFVGCSSFAAGEVANRFGYSAAFVMAACALGAAAIAGRFVFTRKQPELVVEDETLCPTDSAVS